MNRRVRPELVFLVLAIVFGSAFALMTPPFDAPDEPNHLFRVYQLSEGHVFARQLGGELPRSLVDLGNRYAGWWLGNRSIELPNIWSQVHQPLRPTDRQVARFPNTAVYSPVPYLPQVVGVIVGRIVRASPLGLMYSARLFGAVGYAATGFLAIRVMPICKWPACVGLLAPTAIFLAGSVSADPMTTAVVTLTTAMVLRIALADRPATGRGIASLAICAVSVALCKSVYTPVVLLVAAVPGRNWPGRWGRVWPLLGYSVVEVAMGSR